MTRKNTFFSYWRKIDADPTIQKVKMKLCFQEKIEPEEAQYLLDLIEELIAENETLNETCDLP